MLEVSIRLMEHSDWPEAKAIYQRGIQTGIATFEATAPEWQEWDRAHLIFGRLVAEVAGKVVGWAALSPVSSRCVYGGVAEVSVYMDGTFRNKGIGQKLMQVLILESEQNGNHEAQPPSLTRHRDAKRPLVPAWEKARARLDKKTSEKLGF